MTMPVLFAGHGSPTNILADNEFTRALKKLSGEIPRPRAILVVSAHWETPTPQVHNSPNPRTIHDFGGFPRNLYQTGYHSKGAPDLAFRIGELTSGKVKGTSAWGLDHGAWSILIHLYPEGDIPAAQLSLARTYSFSDHLALARQLQTLREEGVLILASGNIVHNLHQIIWTDNAAPASWAKSFDLGIAAALQQRNELALLEPDRIAGPDIFKQAHPTWEHYLPLLYAFGASRAEDRLRIAFEEIQNATISMQTFLYEPISDPRRSS